MLLSGDGDAVGSLRRVAGWGRRARGSPSPGRGFIRRIRTSEFEWAGRLMLARTGARRRDFFIFYFSFSFFTKIYFCFRNLQKYTTAVPLPGSRDLVAPLWGSRGFSAKIFVENWR